MKKCAKTAGAGSRRIQTGIDMKNYIWDFDGMLFDSYPHIVAAFCKMMQEKGIEVDPAEAQSLFEITYGHAYEHYGITKDDGLIHQKYEHDYELEPKAVPFPNTIETVKALYERGARHFLYTHRGHESSQYYLKKYELDKYFDGFVDSSMNFAPKPSPDAVNWICEAYCLEKSETVMIGDREIDVLSGKNAGVYGCLFTRKEGVQSKADFVIHDIIEVLSL